MGLIELLDIQVVRLSHNVEIILLLDINCEIKSSSTEHVQCLFGMTAEEMRGKDLRKLVRFVHHKQYQRTCKRKQIRLNLAFFLLHLLLYCRLSVIRRRRGSIALSVMEDLTLTSSPKRRKPSFGDDMFDLNIWAIAQEPVRVELTLVPIPFEMKVSFFFLNLDFD
jgi:hypothetical protein